MSSPTNRDSKSPLNDSQLVRGACPENREDCWKLTVES